MQFQAIQAKIQRRKGPDSYGQSGDQLLLVCKGQSLFLQSHNDDLSSRWALPLGPLIPDPAPLPCGPVPVPPGLFLSDTPAQVNGMENDAVGEGSGLQCWQHRPHQQVSLPMHVTESG